MTITDDTEESDGDLLGGWYCAKKNIAKGYIDAGFRPSDAVALKKEESEGEGQWQLCNGGSVYILIKLCIGILMVYGVEGWWAVLLDHKVTEGSSFY